ncbi:MAG: polysaccharide pyruvyl transferase family protein [Pirellulales bacterium]|nr:polysaccharide pyruvyl transferase family protein [Pirellulales bacterium]
MWQLLRKSPVGPEVKYWGENEKSKNIGDFLGVYIQRKLFGPAKPDCPPYVYLIGSVIADPFMKLAKGRAVGFWGCGLRGPQSLSNKYAERARVFGVRGLLSQSCLKDLKPPVTGDTSFLLPLIYRPTKDLVRQTKSVFVPHIFDPRTQEEMIRDTGAETILHPSIEGTDEAIETWIDSLATARFVLSGSLHGLILAYLYNVPCAIYGGRPLDCPFKWLDFLTSVDEPMTAHDTVQSGIDNSPLRNPGKPSIDVRRLLETCPFEILDHVLESNQKARVIWPYGEN